MVKKQKERKNKKNDNVVFFKQVPIIKKYKNLKRKATKKNDQRTKRKKK